MAHPRRCGDHCTWSAVKLIGSGSSPQVRGPRSALSSDRVVLWLIPAGAGTTGKPKRTHPTLRAHPRRCGDHAGQPIGGALNTDSSPQVRGPLRGRHCPNCALGLIPAGAGTTLARHIPPVAPGAHPRRCGDHAEGTVGVIIGVGSSPQVRGPQDGMKFEFPSEGLIPAGAGTTY